MPWEPARRPSDDGRAPAGETGPDPSREDRVGAAAPPGRSGTWWRVWPHLLSRRALLGLLAATLGALVALWLWGQARPDDSLRRVQAAGVLRVGMEASFPPFETTDGRGNFGGFDVDLANSLARGLGVEAQFDNLSYDTLYDALAARRVDVLISMIVPEAERTADVWYSPAYFDGGLVLVTAEGSTAINATKDLAGRRVAVEAGSMAEEEGRRLAGGLAGLVVVTYSEPQEVLAAVSSGQADAGISELVSIADFRRGGGKVRVLAPALTSEPYVLCALRQDQALAKELERLLGVLRSTGGLDRLAAIWF
jgi:ABC-type amino acid transport substrate-binding protein